MKILNFGSLNLDHVYTVEHFVRDGETISALELNDFCGGKGLNQSIAAARAGAKVFHAGKIGEDGQELRKRLEQGGVDTKYLAIDPAAPTGHAIIQVDKGGQNCIIICGGANRAITESDVDAVLADFGEGDILMLQNETSKVDYIIKKAHERGMKIALNPSPLDEALEGYPELQLVDWFILNEIEGLALSGKTEPDEILTEMKKRYPNSAIMLTLGKDGAIYYDGTTRASHGIYDVKPVDTTAAGDTFAGYFIACLSEGLPIEKVLELASKASSLAVGRPGASDSIPERSEVETTGIKPL